MKFALFYEIPVTRVVPVVREAQAVLVASVPQWLEEMAKADGTYAYLDRARQALESS